MTDSVEEPGMGADRSDREFRFQAGRAEDEGRVGIFPSWASLYTTVIVYGVLVIAALLILTRLLSF